MVGKKSPRESGGFAEGRCWRSETPDDDAQTCGRRRRNHIGSTTGATIPIDDSSGTIIRHLAVADRTGELSPPTPVGGEGAERQPAGAGIAFGKGIGAGSAAGHDFDIIRRLFRQQIIQIGR